MYIYDIILPGILILRWYIILPRTRHNVCAREHATTQIPKTCDILYHTAK